MWQMQKALELDRHVIVTADADGSTTTAINRLCAPKPGTAEMTFSMKITQIMWRLSALVMLECHVQGTWHSSIGTGCTLHDTRRLHIRRDSAHTARDAGNMPSAANQTSALVACGVASSTLRTVDYRARLKGRTSATMHSNTNSGHKCCNANALRIHK